MKLLVLAHTPPPVHGQSLMVRLLLEGLRTRPGLELHHVNLALSRDTADIGRWRPGKFFALLAACLRARRLARIHGPMTLYYVPAPAKRGALCRDWLVMLLCRSRFTRLVLHWHASGLGEWLQTRATAPERTITRRLLGRADLSLVLAPELAADADILRPRRTLALPNALTWENLPPSPPPRPRRDRCELLYVGLLSPAKGTFDTLEALIRLHARTPGAYRLTLAGNFETDADAERFHRRAEALGDHVRHVGFADEASKARLYADADLLCFPTAYAHEGQPLVLIEALAHDLPIVTTRWRAIPGMLPPGSPHVHYVEPHRPDQIADAIQAARKAGAPEGLHRRYYEEHYTPARHLAALAAALLSVTPGNG